MDARKQHMNKYASGMAEIVLSRTMLSREVLVVFNTITRDHYQDATITETGRYKKLAMIKKTMDMQYVQELLGPELLEDNLDQIPWVVNMTTENLPRVPRMDDQVIIEGIRYTISVVKPMNRDLESLISLFIYPERVVGEDPLAIKSVTYSVNGQTVASLASYVGSTAILDILYGGYPLYMSFDGTTWVDFVSKVKAPVQNNLTLYLKNGVGTVVSKVL